MSAQSKGYIAVKNQTRVPFASPDIKKLARFIRTHLHDSHEVEVKQTQMLDLLARSQGYRNFAALKACTLSASSVEPPQEQRSGVTAASTTDLKQSVSTQQRLLKLRLHNTGFRETFIKGSEGEWIDRREVEVVDQLAYSMNVRIEAGDLQAEVILHVDANPLDGRFSSDLKVDEDLVKMKSLDALSEHLKTTVGSFDFFGPVNVAISLGNADNATSDSPSSAIHEIEQNVPKPVFDEVSKAITFINIATENCESVVTRLKALTRPLGRQLSGAERQWLDHVSNYLQQLPDLSGQPFMFSWNREKLTGVRHAIERWQSGEWSNEDQWVLQDLSVFQPPRAWYGPPPEVPPAPATLNL